MIPGGCQDLEKVFCRFNVQYNFRINCQAAAYFVLKFIFIFLQHFVCDGRKSYFSDMAGLLWLCR